MPEFSVMSLQEAQRRLQWPDRGPFMDEYIGYLAHLSRGQAGVLRLTGQDTVKPFTIKNRLRMAAQALNMPLVVRITGTAVYFWPEQQATFRRRRRAAGGAPESRVLPTG